MGKMPMPPSQVVLHDVSCAVMDRQRHPKYPVTIRLDRMVSGNSLPLGEGHRRFQGFQKSEVAGGFATAGGGSP